MPAISPILGGASADAEYMDHHGVRAHFGIPRSTAYELWEAGKIKTVSLKKNGAIRGRRLFIVRSIRDYLESCAEQDTAGRKS